MRSSAVFSSRWKIVGFIVLLALIIPFPTVLVNEWTLRVVDENSSPLPNVKVENNWTNYDHPFSGGLEARRSDEDGYITFPARYVWGNLSSRIVFSLLASLSTLAHGSTGHSIYVRIYDECYYTKSDGQIHWYSNWDAGQSLPETIVGIRDPEGCQERRS